MTDSRHISRDDAERQLVNRLASGYSDDNPDVRKLRTIIQLYGEVENLRADYGQELGRLKAEIQLHRSRINLLRGGLKGGVDWEAFDKWLDE